MPQLQFSQRNRLLHVYTGAAASHIKAEVDNLANRFPNTDPVLLEVDRRRDELEKLIQSHDIVIRSPAFCFHVLRSQNMCVAT